MLCLHDFNQPESLHLNNTQSGAITACGHACCNDSWCLLFHSSPVLHRGGTACTTPTTRTHHTCTFFLGKATHLPHACAHAHKMYTYKHTHTYIGTYIHTQSAGPSHQYSDWQRAIPSSSCTLLLACVLAAQVSGPQRDLHSGNDGGVICEPMMDLVKVMATLLEPGKTSIRVRLGQRMRVHACATEVWQMKGQASRGGRQRWPCALLWRCDGCELRQACPCCSW